MIAMTMIMTVMIVSAVPVNMRVVVVMQVKMLARRRSIQDILVRLSISTLLQVAVLKGRR